MQPIPPQRSEQSAKQLSLFSEAVAEDAPQRKSWLWLIPVLLLSGFLGWRFVIPSTNAQAPTAQTRSGPPPRAVEMTSLKSGAAETRVQLLGQVEAAQQSTIRAQANGVVREILVQPGDRITVGMTIAVLDDSEQRLSVAEAQAQLAQQKSNLARLEVGTRPEIIAQRQAAVTAAQAREREAQDNLTRTANLVTEGAVTKRALIEVQAALDTARAQRLQAQAELAEAKAGPIREEIEAQQANVAAATAAVNQAQLSQQRTQVVASTGGIVQNRRVSRGDLVQSGGEILTLIAQERLDVFLEVPENLTAQVRSGASVELTTRALPNWKQRATITAIVPSADPTSRRQRVRVELPNPPQGLTPGMAIEASLIQPSNRTGWIVSRDVLTQRQNRWFVFTVADDKAKPIPVEIVADMGQDVAIASPELRQDMTIVARGGDGLQEGTPVKVVQPGKAI
jgi:HlyD family secretion protein